MVSDAPGGAIVDIKVIPRAGRTTLAGTRDGAVLVRLAAAPADGAANAALLDFLARTLQHPRAHLALIAGERSRKKRVKVTGISVTVLCDRLGIPSHER